jgi:hypothetical protein
VVLDERGAVHPLLAERLVDLVERGLTVHEIRRKLRDAMRASLLVAIENRGDRSPVRGGVMR